MTVGMTIPADAWVVPGAAGFWVDDMPEADYFAHPALSSSGARKLLPPGCPALFKWERDNRPPSTPTFDIGHAAHKLVLGVGQPIVQVDADDWRTNAAKAARDQAYADGAIPLLRKEHATVTAMADAIRAHPVTGALFAPDRGRAELSIFWHDEDFDIDRRARVDWLLEGPQPVVVDYKSTVSADPGSFAKAAANYGYFQQADWYLEAAAAIGLDRPAFVLVAQEKQPPYLVSIFELDDDALRLGHERNLLAMEVYADCLANDTWPGHGDDIHVLHLPAWAYKTGLV